FFSSIPPPPLHPLFPYTTLFRSPFESVRGPQGIGRPARLFPMVLYESDRTDRENQKVAATGISLVAKDPCLFKRHPAASQARPLLGGSPSLRHCGGTAVDSDSFASTSVGWSSQTMRTQAKLRRHNGVPRPDRW